MKNQITEARMVPSKKVLIVDDDSVTRQLVRRVLKRLDFVDFLEAENGAEAIRMARDEHPDLILMDIRMPGMDGYEACRQIKNDPALKSIIVIFMTAVSMDEIDDRVIQAEGDDLLRKPLDASELYFRVKNYLTLMMPKTDLKTISSAPVKGVSDFCHHEENIDLGEGFYYEAHSKRVVKAKQYIPLMQQEVLLLEAFIKYQNHVMPYERLLQIIGKNGESTIANLRTLIKLLRRKTYRGMIRTLPSIGYQFMAR